MKVSNLIIFILVINIRKSFDNLDVDIEYDDE